MERELDEVHIIYTQMQNAAVMEPVDMQLLPLKKTEFSPFQIPAGAPQEEIEMFPSADAVLEYNDSKLSDRSYLWMSCRGICQ